MICTRRDLGRIALAAIPAGKMPAKPNSSFGGVQIGIILSPTALPGIPLKADDVLRNLVELGISGVEMQDVRVEAYAGAPGSARGGAALTPEQRRQAGQDNKQWRLSAPMDKYKTLRKMYAGAGVEMYAFRVGRFALDMAEEEYAYFFDAAEALGAKQITTELPKDPALSDRIGAYAARRKMMIAYHNHTQVNFESWDTALSQSAFNGINFDVGHFAAAVSQSPIPFIEKHYGRIASLHLKDRKFGSNGGKNVPWGEGDTPLKEILALVKKQKYGFPATIELEYPIPEGSSVMAEIAKCVRFCQETLG